MEVPKSIKDLVERAGNSSAWHAASALPRSFYRGGMDTMTSPSNALEYASEQGPEALKTLAKITGSVAIPAATVLGGVQIGRHLLGSGEDEHKYAAIREDAINATLAHYKVAGVWDAGAKVVGTLGKAVSRGSNAGGVANRAFSGFGKLEAANQGLGAGLKVFHRAGGTEAAGKLVGGAALGGAGLYGAARVAGSGFNAGQPQQQQQQQQQPQYR